ncbi:hypothetical protein [Mesorhizobium sp.]|uniref:hypothetical protein n=1 Tax=Mesorhizobium sp. TaxID=1871066 RepID=UPI000FE900CB|nr:hypothetical protein [Mesorhizobium sp.]RWI35448.1 MAG: hypothetical protein EOR14_28515 [Mesorhizobium sp.]RWJ66383.1 MAG: hypothetical protein EOR34_28620 [Mesorhizobium sp.]
MNDTEEFVDLLRGELRKLEAEAWRDYRNTMSDLMRTREDLELIKVYASDDNSTDARIRLLAKSALLKRREFEVSLEVSLYQSNPNYGIF